MKTGTFSLADGRERIPKHGMHPTGMENTSYAIATCNVVYVASAELLMAAALVFARRDMALGIATPSGGQFSSTLVGKGVNAT